MRRLLWGLTLLVLAVAARPQGTAPVRLLYPPARSVHARPVRLVLATAQDAAAPAATLDGQALPLTRLAFAENWVMPGKLKTTAELVGDRTATALWVATLNLQAGPHNVLVGGQALELRGAAPTAAADPAQCYAHPPVGEAVPDCGGCHELTEGKLGPVRTPQACADCHDESNVQLKHRHVSEPLARCAMCHDPHGTARPRMLVADKKVLCSKCHEAGHSKD